MAVTNSPPPSIRYVPLLGGPAGERSHVDKSSHSLMSHPVIAQVKGLVPCHARFRDNPLVTGPPHILFYAGAPLVTVEGYRLGSLCVIDREPRRFDAESCNLLCNFAEMVVREIEKEKTRVRAAILFTCCLIFPPGPK